jgi:hypothetical protein
MGATTEQKAKAAILIIICIIFIVIATKYAYESEKELKKDLTLSQFLSIDKTPALKNVLVGMASGLVFGFIDNLGLYVGMDSLDPFFSNDPLIRAGQGNTFSDLIGSFLGTFIGVIIKNKSQINDYPVWSESIGIVVGCLIGVYLPAAIFGSSSK